MAQLLLNFREHGPQWLDVEEIQYDEEDNFSISFCSLWWVDGQIKDLTYISKNEESLLKRARDIAASQALKKGARRILQSWTAHLALGPQIAAGLKAAQVANLLYTGWRGFIERKKKGYYDNGGDLVIEGKIHLSPENFRE